MAHPDAIILAGATDVGLWVTKQHQALGPTVVRARHPPRRTSVRRATGGAREARHRLSPTDRL